MFVYCIINKLNKKRYIGITTQTIKQRFQDHICDSRVVTYKSRLYNAFRKHGIDNFEYFELHRNNDIKFLYKLEQCYIKKFKTTNSELGYNINIGGNGGDNYTNHPDMEHVRNRIKEGLKNGKKPDKSYLTDPVKRKAWLNKLRISTKKRLKKRTVEQEETRKDKENQTKAKNGTLANSEKMRKINSEKQIGRVVSDKTKKKLSKALTGRIFSEEHKVNISKGKIGNTPWNKGIKNETKK